MTIPKKKIKLALVRGDSLNPWEVNLWKDLQDEFEIVAFCAKKNLYSTDTIPFPIKRLPSSTDNFFSHTYAKYFQGRFNAMYGLEKELASFDIVHAVEVCYYYTFQSLQAKLQNPKLKVVASVSDNSFGRFEYNYWPGFSIPPQFWRRKINYIVDTNIRELDGFLPITQYSADFLKFYGAEPQKMHVLMSGVDLTAATDLPPTEELQKITKIIEGRQVYMMVNRLVKEKGVYDVLYAWKMFLHKRTGDNQLLLIVGKGPERDNMKRLVEEWGLGAKVYMVDSLPNHEVRTLYAKAQALILGSVPNSVWQEQFGYVLAEAIMSGCPVVSTLSGAIPEVVEDAGILVPPLNPVAMAEALEKLSIPEEYQRAKSACTRVCAKFSVQHYVKVLRTLYHNLVHE